MKETSEVVLFVCQFDKIICKIVFYYVIYVTLITWRILHNNYAEHEKTPKSLPPYGILQQGILL